MRPSRNGPFQGLARGKDERRDGWDDHLHEKYVRRCAQEICLPDGKLARKFYLRRERPARDSRTWSLETVGVHGKVVLCAATASISAIAWDVVLRGLRALRSEPVLWLSPGVERLKVVRVISKLKLA